MPFDSRHIIRTLGALGEISGGLIPAVGVTVDLIELLVRNRKAAKERELNEAIDKLTPEELHQLALKAGVPLDDEALSEFAEAYATSLYEMERATEELDPELQEPARRVVEANLEYIEAEQEAREALEKGDTVAHAAALRKQERIDREIQTFELMKGMHDAMKQSAGTLAEIKAARELASLEQTSQAAFNKKMALVAIVVAGGSLGAALFMPFVEHAFLKDPAPVVVIQQSTGEPPATTSTP